MSKKNTLPSDELVEILPPRESGREDPNCFVGLNGVNYLLPRGKRTLVSAAVAEEFARAQAAREAMYEAQDALRAR